MVKGAKRASSTGGSEVGILADDHGRLAAEL